MQEQFNEKAIKFQFGQAELGIYVGGGGEIYGKLVRQWRQICRSSTQEGHV